eukprot:CAMPEP_0171447020 /NCGR_PEP_ID=MMETSP0881-20121228/38892_1 /TAXON_ID=67004 /ORGANISM="Thalassiosira weissflogii, Strain CCMP1336" /LENGTH=1426 /DNA_ID=CAMNT_0011971421 /DNA_START=48 /DNA_END=4329 /DNA_ORIENTATION=-
MNPSPIAAAALIAACSTSASAQLVNASTRLSRLRLKQAEQNGMLQQHTSTTHENKKLGNDRQRKLIFDPNAEANLDEGKDETASGPQPLVATMEVGLMSSLTSIGSSLSLSMSMAQEISSPEYLAWNNINDETIAGTMAASLSMETMLSMSLPILEYTTANDADPDYTNWNGNEDLFSLSMTESFSMFVSLPMDFVNEENSMSMSMKLNAPLPDEDTSIASPEYSEWSTEEADVDYDLEFSLSQSMSMPSSMSITDVAIESPTFSPAKSGPRSKTGKRPNEDTGLSDDDLIVIPHYPAWNVVDDGSMSLLMLSSMSMSMSMINSTPSTEPEGVEDDDIIGTPSYSWNDETLSLPPEMSFPVSMSMDNTILESPTYSPTKRGPRSKAGKRPIEDLGLTYDELTGIPNYPAWNTDEGSMSLPPLVSMSMSISMSMMITIPSIEMSMPGIESTVDDTMVETPNYSWIDDKLSTPTEATSKPLTMEIYDEDVLILGGSGSTSATTTPVSSTASSTEPPKTKVGKEPSEPYVSNDFALFDVNLNIGNAKATKNLPSRRRLLENEAKGQSLQEIDTKAAKDILGATFNTPESPNESNASNDSPEQEFGKLAPDEAGVFSMSMFSMALNSAEQPEAIAMELNDDDAVILGGSGSTSATTTPFSSTASSDEPPKTKAGKEPSEAYSNDFALFHVNLNLGNAKTTKNIPSRRRLLENDAYGQSLQEIDTKAAKDILGATSNTPGSPNESNASNDSPEQEFGKLAPDDVLSFSVSMFSMALNSAEQPSLVQNSAEVLFAKSTKRRRLFESEVVDDRFLAESDDTKAGKEPPLNSDEAVQEFGNLISDEATSISMSMILMPMNEARPPLVQSSVEFAMGKSTKRRRLFENEFGIHRSLEESVDSKAAKETPNESNASNDSPEQEFGKLAPDDVLSFSVSMFSMALNSDEEPSLVQNSAEVLFAKSTKRRRLFESEVVDDRFLAESDDTKAGKEPPLNSEEAVQEFGNLISDEATSISMSMILMPMNEARPPLVQSSVEFAMGKSMKRRRLFEDEFGIHRSLEESVDSKAAKETPNESNASNDSPEQELFENEFGIHRSLEESVDSKAAKETPNESNASNDSPEQEFGNLVSDDSISLSMSMFSNALHFAEPSLAQNSVEFFPGKSLKRRRLTEFEGFGRRSLVGSKSDKESPDESDASVKPEQEFGNLIFDQSFSLSMSVPGNDNSLVDFTLQEDLNDDIIVIGGPVPNPSIKVPPLEQTDFDIYLEDSLPTKTPSKMNIKVVSPLDEDPPSFADDSGMFRNFPTLVPTPMNSEIVIPSPSKDLLVQQDNFNTIGDIIPTYMPTSEQTSEPSTSPTHLPTSYPTSDPTYVPTDTPTSELTSADTFSSPTNYPSTSSTELNSKSAKAEESFEEKNNDEEIASKTLKDDSSSKAGKRQL